MVPPKKQVWTLHRCAPLCTLQGVVAKLCLSYGDSHLHKENIISVKWWRRYPHAVMISRVPFHSGAGVDTECTGMQQMSGQSICPILKKQSRGVGLPWTAFLGARTRYVHSIYCSRCFQNTHQKKSREEFRCGRDDCVWKLSLIHI